MDIVQDEHRLWSPLSPDEVADLLAHFPRPWWLAGGWALDLHLGRQTRRHGDLDVVVLRQDHQLLQQHLSDWILLAADPPGTLRPWLPGERLSEPVRDIWCRPQDAADWSMQLMIIDPVLDQWVYRREPRITRPLRELTGPASRPGLPVLAPEVQLLYKSKQPRPKDQLDFDTFRCHLDADQRRWLREALTLTDAQHPWLSQM